MKITPIMAYRSQNLQSKKQNVSFGRFENEETKQYVKKYLLADVPESLSSQLIKYMDETPFFTVKMAKGLDGKPFVYTVMNKEETDKHQYKTKFDEIKKNKYDYSDDWSLDWNKPAKQTGITSSEPGFLTVLENGSAVYDLCDTFIKVQQGYKEPEIEQSTLTNSDNYSNDDEESNFDKAVKLNGGGLF